jgi:putative flippase GtrA
MKSTKKTFITLFVDIFKYGLASIVAMAADVGILYVLVEYFQFHYMYASTAAFCFGLVFHYFLVKMFVFTNSKMEPKKEFILYSIIGLIGLGLNNLIIYVLVFLNLWYLYAKLISVVLVFFFNFFSRRKLFND